MRALLLCVAAAAGAAAAALLTGATTGARGCPTRFDYLFHDELTKFIDDVAAQHGDLARKFVIGKSFKKRTTAGLHLTAHGVGDVASRPHVKLIGNMHGDEAVGRVVLRHFVCHMVTAYAAGDALVKRIMDSTNIWVVPTINPDGFEAGVRENDAGIDLNRNFPDGFKDNRNTVTGRAPEVQNVMKWTAQRNFVLSLNFHGGALVANYPYDQYRKGEDRSRDGPVPSVAPDDALFIALSRVYADNHTTMATSLRSDSFACECCETTPDSCCSPFTTCCNAFAGRVCFDRGITNGAHWYEVDGSIQDWEYHYHQTLAITIETGDIKTPQAVASVLEPYWTQNKPALLAIVQHVHRGVRGTVRNELGHPVRAKVSVVGGPTGGIAVHSWPTTGLYHRVLLEGDYTLRFEADGHVAAEHAVRAGPLWAPATLDVTLQREPNAGGSGSTGAGDGGNANAATPSGATGGDGSSGGSGDGGDSGGTGAAGGAGGIAFPDNDGTDCAHVACGFVTHTSCPKGFRLVDYFGGCCKACHADAYAAEIDKTAAAAMALL